MPFASSNIFLYIFSWALKLSSLKSSPFFYRRNFSGLTVCMFHFVLTFAFKTAELLTENLIWNHSTSLLSPTRKFEKVRDSTRKSQNIGMANSKKSKYWGGSCHPCHPSSDGPAILTVTSVRPSVSPFVTKFFLLRPWKSQNIGVEAATPATPVPPALRPNYWATSL